MTTTQLAMSGALDNISFNEVVKTGSTGTTQPPATSTATTTGRKKIEDTRVGGFLNMLLSNGGNIAQIISAIKGNAPTIKDGTGKTHDLTGVRAEIEKISAQKNQDMATVMQMMMVQLQKDKSEKPKKDNTALYVGLGVGALVLLGGIFYVTQNKKK